MQIKKIVLTLALLSALSARADGFKMRAREHYETVNLHLDQYTPNTTYGGFSNTINLWYEKPLTYAFGIAASPLGATLPRQGAAVDPTLGDRIRLVHIGLEAKAFPLPSHGLFTRIGIYRATLQTNGTAGVLSGGSALAAVGYEWLIGQVGLAFEWAVRRGEVGANAGFTGAAPAIGVHFYQI